MHTATIPLVTFGLLAGVLSAQQEFVVDRANRPGATHTTISAAIAAAAPGDRIVVRRDGTAPYRGFTLNKGLVIRGNYGEFPEVEWASIRAVPAGQSVRLERMIVRSQAASIVEVVGCAGTVILRQVFAASGAVAGGSAPAMRIERSALVIHDLGGLSSNRAEPCVVVSSTAMFRGVQMSGATLSAVGGLQGAPGLVATSSRIVLHDCRITGGAGVPASPNPFGGCYSNGSNGSNAVVAQTSDVLLTGGTQLTGGPGGSGSGGCPSGARGLALSGSSFRIDPSVRLLGATAGAMTSIALQPALGNLPVVVDAGTSTSVDLTAAGPGVWGLFVDLEPGHLELAGVDVPFQLGPSALPILYGALPAAGATSIPLGVPVDPALIERVLWFQAGVVRAPAELRISNAASLGIR